MLAAVVAGALATSASGAPEAASELEPTALPRAKAIRAELNARYRRVPGRTLTVREATTTSVIESFTLVGLDGVRTVPAANGIWYAICPRRGLCPHPGPRLARPAGDFLPRRLALELAVRTFLETSADMVAVGLPTLRFTLFVVERHELEDLPALVTTLRGSPGRSPAASLLQTVDELTRPRVFVAAELDPTPSGGETLVAYPRWLTA